METNLAKSTESLLAEIGWIRSLALQLVRDVAAADDLVQETLLAALERRPDDEQPLRPWLGTVVRRRASLLRRGDARRRAREEREARTEALPSAEELAARAQVQRAVVDAVLALSEPYRSTVLLRYFEDLAPQEIARRRDIPAATVRSHLKRGLDELRATLDRRHDGDSRSWCLALIPLAVERTGLKSALTSSLTATLALIVMNTWFQVAVGVAALAVLSLWFWPTEGSPTAASVSLGGEAVGELTPLNGSQTEAENSSENPEREAVAPLVTDSSVASRGAFAGRVVDATGAPLAEYALVIENADGTEEVLVTDTNGRFKSQLERDPGSIKVRLRDVAAARGRKNKGDEPYLVHETTLLEISWDGRAEVALVDELSRTFQLRFVPPSGLSHTDFEGELLSHDPRSVSSDTWIHSARTRVRGGTRPFVRFSLRAHLTEDLSDKPTLRLESRDGLWAGQAAVPAAEGSCEIAIEIAPAAVLQLELLHIEGAKLVNPKFKIQNLAYERAMRRVKQKRDSIELRALDPGRYRVKVTADGVQPIEKEFHLARGQRLTETLLLWPLESPAHVRGELRSGSGSWEGPGPYVRLISADGWVRHDPANVIEVGGQLVCRFAFENVAAGDYQLVIGGTVYGELRWSPHPGVVRAPVEGLVFECDDTTLMQRER